MKKNLLASILTVTTIIFASTSCASAKAEPSAPVAEPVKETVASPEDAEYLRSKGDVDVSAEEFAEDKKQILAIISKLDGIMKDLNYNAWYSYVDEESIDYWSKSANLKRAAARLPVKGMKLNSLQDYFKYVFVPARAGRTIDEIRYETTNQVKVVQFQDESDKIYYNFNRIDGKWKVHLPPLDD